MDFYKLPFKLDYKYVKDTAEAIGTLQELSKFNMLAVDTETTGLDPYTSFLLLLQIATPEGKAFTYDMRYVSPEALRPVLEDNNVRCILHNAKFDYKFLKCKYGIELPKTYDTMLAERIGTLGLFQEASLGYVINKYLGYQVDKSIRNEFLYFNVKHDVFTESQIQYSSHDVVCLFDIMKHQTKHLQKYNLIDVCNLEFDLIKHIGDMELNGVKIDTDLWMEVIDETEIKLESLIDSILPMLSDAAKQTGLFGMPAINLGSQQQLLDALRNLGLNIEDTSMGSLTDVQFDHEVIPLILDFRAYTKILNSFGDNILSLINPVTGRIHANFNQLVSTGRLSCSSPNLQQIPGDSRFRQCFIARDGYKLITADMSQAELRILASYADETAFKKAIADGVDLHASNASFVFDVSYDEVLRDKKLPDDNPNKRDYRSKVKALVFGLIYGMSSYGLSHRLKIPEDEAQDLIDLFFKKFPNAKRFLDKAAEQPLIKHYSETISGRKRFFKMPEPYMDKKERKMLVSSIRRRGMNTPIQGCIAHGMHVAGAGFINNNVGNILQLPVGTRSPLLSKGVYSGIKDVYRVTTRLGFQLEATNDHKVRIQEKRWMAIKDIQRRSILFTAVPYKGKPTSINKVITQLGIRGSKYMTEGYAFMFGVAITTLLTNDDTLRFNTTNGDIEKVFILYYRKAFGNKPLIRTFYSDRLVVIKIGKTEAALLRLFAKNYFKFLEIILKSPIEVRFAFIAGFILNNFYTISYGMQEALYFKCDNDGKSKHLQQVLLSVGVVASSSRNDIITDSVGCLVSSEFIGILAKGIDYIDMNYEDSVEVKDFRDRVVSIEYVGKKKVYDFIGKRKPHSFVCQGMYVHNSNADVIKKATCILGDRLKKFDDARLILQVHDEVVVEAKEEEAEEVAKVVSESIVDGWDFYFKDVPMEADANIKPYWEK